MDDNEALKDLDRSFRAIGVRGDKKEQTYTPSYSMLGHTRIPVARSTGTLWKSRRDQAMRLRSRAADAWTEAIMYYENDQAEARKKYRPNMSSGSNAANTLSDEWCETENVVFANTSTLVPMLYSRNPAITVTPTNDAEHLRGLGTAVQQLVNSLFSLKTAPGINLKPLARRAVLSALLTNAGWLELEWTFKDNSSEGALDDMLQLSQELADAKTPKDIEVIEGKLRAVEETIDIMAPEGPSIRFRHPTSVLVDPADTDGLLDKAGWVMTEEFLPTAYIQAKYANRVGEEYQYLYKPTHVLKGAFGSEAVLEEQVANFTLLEADSEYADYGFSSREAFDRARYTRVWRVWDKRTRRVYLFSDQDWTWPLWVWDDPYKLPRFFPHFKLSFHDSVDGPNARGEVTYYLAQQDAINDILSERARWRRWASRKLVFAKDRGITKDEVQAFLSGVDLTVLGVDLPEGGSVADIVSSVTPPSIKYEEIFDTSAQMGAIDRLSSVREVMRGAQFKTNTTNKAIETYQASAEIRLDDKTDLIEEFIGDIGYNLALLCIDNMDIGTVTEIIGEGAAMAWPQDTLALPPNWKHRLTFIVEGGSSTKPTAKHKRQEAMELGQILGQFADASPAVVMVLLKMFEGAFTDFTITSDDWALIKETMLAQQTKAGAGPGNVTSADNPTTGPDDAQKAELVQIVKSLPPEAKAALQQMVQQGMSPTEALQTVMQQMQG